jgi:hypothetical protein
MLMCGLEPLCAMVLLSQVSWITPFISKGLGSDFEWIRNGLIEKISGCWWYCSLILWMADSITRFKRIIMYQYADKHSSSI